MYFILLTVLSLSHIRYAFN